MNTLRRTLILMAATVAALGTITLGMVAPASATATPQLKGATLAISHPVIYPRADGYRDSLNLSVTGRLSVAHDGIPLTGRLTIKRHGVEVTSYPITTSATETYFWNGEFHGRVVHGHYGITATLTDGTTTIVKKTTVIVSLKRLVSRVKVVTLSAQAFFQHSYTATTANTGCSPAGSGSLVCTSAKGAPATGGNYVAVPTPVLAYAGYRPYTASVAVTLSHVAVATGSHTFWDWDGVHSYAFTSAGTHLTAAATFGAGTVAQTLKFRLQGGSAAQFDKIVITYTYSVLH